MSSELESRLRICSENLHTESTKNMPDFNKVSSESDIFLSYERKLNVAMEEENNVELSPIISLLQHVQRSLDIILENESIDIQTKITEDRNMIFQKIQLLMDRQLRAKKWDDLLDEEEEY